MMSVFFLLIRRPPRSPRTDTLFPYTTLFRSLELIRTHDGSELFDAALAAGRGVIVAAPHYGNWELLNQWLAMRTPLAILYRPPESAVGEAFLRRVRADEGDRVTQVRAEGPGIRQLFKVLKAGGVVGILPDQQPKAGEIGIAH